LNHDDTSDISNRVFNQIFRMMGERKSNNLIIGLLCLAHTYDIKEPHNNILEGTSNNAESNKRLHDSLIDSVKHRMRRHDIYENYLTDSELCVLYYYTVSMKAVSSIIKPQRNENMRCNEICLRYYFFKALWLVRKCQVKYNIPRGEDTSYLYRGMANVKWPVKNFAPGSSITLPYGMSTSESLTVADEFTDNVIPSVLLSMKGNFINWDYAIRIVEFSGLIHEVEWIVWHFEGNVLRITNDTKNQNYATVSVELKQ